MELKLGFIFKDMLTQKGIAHFADQLPAGVKVVDMRDYDTKNIWSFVEKFYPDYYSCPEITYNNDLERIVEGEPLEEYSSSYEVYKEIAAILNVSDDQSNEYARETIVNTAEALLKESNSEIYERAIQGFLEFMRGGNQ